MGLQRAGLWSAALAQPRGRCSRCCSRGGVSRANRPGWSCLGGLRDGGAAGRPLVVDVSRSAREGVRQRASRRGCHACLGDRQHADAARCGARIRCPWSRPRRARGTFTVVAAVIAGERAPQWALCSFCSACGGHRYGLFAAVLPASRSAPHRRGRTGSVFALAPFPAAAVRDRLPSTASRPGGRSARRPACLSAGATSPDERHDHAHVH